MDSKGFDESEEMIQEDRNELLNVAHELYEYEVQTKEREEYSIKCNRVKDVAKENRYEGIHVKVNNK